MNDINGKKKIRVLLVDDSRTAITVLERMLCNSPDITVIGTAMNGREAMRLIRELNPDVICTDLHMPVMDGLALTREVMKTSPRPILVVSVSVYEGSENVFDLIEAGALDVYCKPRGALNSDFEKHASDLIRKIRILAGVRVIKKMYTEPSAITQSHQPDFLMNTVRLPPPNIVIIGASTGGPQALEHILQQLPFDFTVPIVCVQHITEGFMEGMMEWLSTKCSIRAQFALTGEYPTPGTVYFAQEDKHLEFSPEGRFVVSKGPPLSGHCPSITVTMRSAAECFNRSAVGVLLTGMGKDGAEGLLAIRKAGGITIAQDESSCIVFGMPKQAIEMGGAVHVLSLNDIARAITGYVQTK